MAPSLLGFVQACKDVGRSGNLNGNGIGCADDVIAFVEVNQLWLVVEQFNIAIAGISSDDDAITYCRLMGCGTIDGNDARTCLCAYGIGCEPFTIADVIDLYLLELAYATGIKQVAINGAGAVIVQLRVSDCGAVEFGFQHLGLHVTALSKRVAYYPCKPIWGQTGIFPNGYKEISRLSINRVVPR